MIKNNKIPVTILGGYLGTGKTTLINNILRTSKKNIAVLVNDFGEINIDESLIDWQKENILSIAGGCICCSYGNELIETLEKMQTMDPIPNHIVLEASGVAIPYKIAQTISLMDFLSLNGNIIMGDASRLLSQLTDKFISDTIQNQFKDHDLLLLNKIDLVDYEVIEECIKKIKSIDQKSNILQVSGAQISENKIFKDYKKIAPKNILNSPDEGPDIDKFITTTLRCTENINIEKLTKLILDPENNIDRAKGFFKDKEGDCFLIQFDGKNLDLNKIDDNKESAIVVIGRENFFDKKKFMSKFNKTLS